MTCPGAPTDRWRPLWLLAPGQVISWGTLYYGITFLAQPIHHETGWRLADLFAAFSAGLLASALAAPVAGGLLARRGGRWGLSLGSLLAAVSLLILAWSPSRAIFLLGWLLAGAAMSFTLYEAAFSALREFYGQHFRRAMTTLTLVGGFASTVFWPLSHWLEGVVGWRTTWLVYAGLHLAVCLPLHRALPRLGVPHDAVAAPPATQYRAALWASPVYWGLALAFGAASLLTGAIAAHAGLLLAGQGVDERTALLAVTLFGPMQVAGRLLDMVLAERFSLGWSGHLAHLAMPLAIALLLLAPHDARFALLFAGLYGAANGVLTLVRGMAPAELMTNTAYGVSLGWLSSPALLARAVAPALAARALERWGTSGTLWGLVGAGLLGLLAFAFAYRVGRVRRPVAAVCVNADG